MTTYIAEDVFARVHRNPRPDRAQEECSPQATEPAALHPVNVDEVLHDSFPASDPPSWTGAIARAATAPTDHHVDDRLVQRVRAEFLEMPGLCLTIGQAQRLWGLAPRPCEALLQSLIDSRFLRRTDRALYVLRQPGR
jgi:hypothetical protein